MLTDPKGFFKFPLRYFLSITTSPQSKPSFRMLGNSFEERMSPRDIFRRGACATNHAENSSSKTFKGIECFSVFRLGFMSIEKAQLDVSVELSLSPEGHVYFNRDRQPSERLPLAEC